MRAILAAGGRDYLLSRLRSSKRLLKQLDSCIVARRSPCRLLSLHPARMSLTRSCDHFNVRRVAGTPCCPGCEAARGCSNKPGHRHRHGSTAMIVCGGTPRPIARLCLESLGDPRNSWGRNSAAPYRGFGDFLWPALPRVEQPGLLSDAPCQGLNSGSMPPPICCPTASSIPDSKKLILADLSFCG